MADNIPKIQSACYNVLYLVCCETDFDLPIRGLSWFCEVQNCRRRRSQFYQNFPQGAIIMHYLRLPTAHTYVILYFCCYLQHCTCMQIKKNIVSAILTFTKLTYRRLHRAFFLFIQFFAIRFVFSRAYQYSGPHSTRSLHCCTVCLWLKCLVNELGYKS